MKQLILFALLAAGGLLAAKPLHWQAGKLLDTGSNSCFVGVDRDVIPTPYGVYDSSSARYRTFYTYVIEGEGMTYMVQERRNLWHLHPANLAVNGPVRYAVDGRKLIVIDDEGKEHSMEIVKRVLRQP